MSVTEADLKKQLYQLDKAAKESAQTLVNLLKIKKNAETDLEEGNRLEAMRNHLKKEIPVLGEWAEEMKKNIKLLLKSKQHVFFRLKEMAEKKKNEKNAKKKKGALKARSAMKKAMKQTILPVKHVKAMKVKKAMKKKAMKKKAMKKKAM